MLTLSHKLWSLIDDHLTRLDRSEAALARQLGVKPQTLSTWKLRGFKTPPEPSTLRAIARVLAVSYSDVLAAALSDTGYLEPDERIVDGLDPLAGLSTVQRALVLAIVEELRAEPEPRTFAADRIVDQVSSSELTSHS